jgi:hypothetical protein
MTAMQHCSVCVTSVVSNVKWYFFYQSMYIFFSTYNASHSLQKATTNHDKIYKNSYINKPKQKLSSTLFFKMSFTCFAANGISWYNNKSIDAKH